MKSIHLGQTSVPDNAAASYFAPGYINTTANATESNVQVVAAASGSFDQIYVNLTVAPGSGKSYTVAVSVNGTPSAVSVTISDAATTGNNTASSVSVSAGDLIAFKVTPSGTPTQPTLMAAAVRFSGTTSAESNFLGNSRAAQLDTSATEYVAFGGTPPGTTESLKRVVVPTGGTVKNFRVRLAAAPGVGKSRTFTVVKNGTDTAIVATIADAATTGSDLTHTVSFSAGDEISVKSVPTSTPAASVVGFGAVFLATVDGEGVIFGANNNSTINDGTNASYALLNGTSVSNTESASFQSVGLACTLQKLYVVVSVAPGNTKTLTFDTRINSASPSNDLSVAITGAATTTGNDTTHTVTVAAADLMGLRVVPTSSPTTGTARWGMVTTFAAPGPANVKTINGLAIASVKTVDDLAIASVKTVNGLA